MGYLQSLTCRYMSLCSSSDSKLLSLRMSVSKFRFEMLKSKALYICSHQDLYLKSIHVNSDCIC